MAPRRRVLGELDARATRQLDQAYLGASLRPPRQSMRPRQRITRRRLTHRLPMSQTANVARDLEEFPVEDHVWFEDRWMVASLCDE
jgi:hypothetical protein